MVYNPQLWREHTQAIAEVDSKLHVQELSSHSQCLLRNHFHRLTEHHFAALLWCSHQGDWQEVFVLMMTRHDPGICWRGLLHHYNKMTFFTSHQ